MKNLKEAANKLGYLQELENDEWPYGGTPPAKGSPSWNAWQASLKKGKAYISTRKLFDNIIRGIKTSGPYQDNPMLTKEEALEIIRHALEVEQADISPEAALDQAVNN